MSVCVCVNQELLKLPKLQIFTNLATNLTEMGR